MIWSNAEQIWCNGKQIECAFANNVQIWPINHVHGYRVYIRWTDSTKYENITMNGCWWNGPMMTEDLIYSETTMPDASYKTNNGYTGMSGSDVDKMISTNTAAATFYANEVTFRVDSTTFNTFEFATDTYYQPEGEAEIEITALTDDGQVVVARKTINLVKNTVYEIFRGN